MTKPFIIDFTSGRSEVIEAEHMGCAVAHGWRLCEPGELVASILNDKGRMVYDPVNGWGWERGVGSMYGECG